MYEPAMRWGQTFDEPLRPKDTLGPHGEGELWIGGDEQGQSTVPPDVGETLGDV